ncbi:MAG: 30S ribosomal protein S1 [Lentisphaeria bacterium]
MAKQSSKQAPSKSIVDLNNLPESMEALLGSTDKGKGMATGKVVNGKVVEKRDNGVLVDIDYKAEGFVPKEEFGAEWEALAVGQEIRVFLDQVEDENSMPRLSVQKARLQQAWENIVTNCAEGSVIKGIIRQRVKGGVIVDVGGVDAFLPGSQVDIGPVRSLESYIGQEGDFKIIKINSDRRNIVVSRRELLEAVRAEQRAALLTELRPNETRRGVVKNITDFGAFVDLNGIDGLLHITDMSWGRIAHPSEMLKVGDEIEVMILSVDHERQRVSLGLKQKEGNPWDTADVKYPVNSRIKGKVVNVMPYGAFVELEEGIEGLIHVSEMSWTKRVTKASDMLKVGDEVEAVVLDVQRDAKKISLGLRQTMENPWEVIAEKFPKGTRIQGKVRNMTSYGAFVQIQDDIDGMIHVSDMSWTRKVNNPADFLQKGQEVEAVILDIDPVQQRISLGMKQLADDPWSNIDAYFKVNDMVEGKVVKIASFGAFVELPHGIEGLIHISQIADKRVEKVKDVLKPDDMVNARVIKIDAEERRIGLSLRAAGAEATPEEIAAATAASTLRPGEAMVDLGDVFASAEREAAAREEEKSE